jgi:hypothetical protein
MGVLSIFISLAALLLSSASVLWSILYGNRIFRATMVAQSEASFVSIEQMLGDLPSALRFHGIAENEVTECGLTPGEFAYLLSSFTAGAIYYRTHGEKGSEPFPLDSYRGVMIRSPQTRAAWPLLRRCTDPSSYRVKIEATIRLVEQIEAQGA